MHFILPVFQPSQVQGVTITRGVSDGSPSLTVSWTAVSGSGITYTVRYSTGSGNETEPPSGASTQSGIAGTSTTLSGLTQGTMYYIWVSAVSSDVQGPYSTRVSETTFEGIRICAEILFQLSCLISRDIKLYETFNFCQFKEWQIVLCHSVVPQRIAIVNVNRTITEDQPLLTVEWSTPSSDRTIQYYQVDYRVGTSGSWSTWSPNPTFTSVTLTGLQSGTSYQVRVRAVSDVGNGEWSEVIGITTYSTCGEFYITS